MVGLSASTDLYGANTAERLVQGLADCEETDRDVPSVTLAGGSPRATGGPGVTAVHPGGRALSRRHRAVGSGHDAEPLAGRPSGIGLPAMTAADVDGSD